MEKRKADRIEIPRSEMPVSPINMLHQGEMGLFGLPGDDDDFFITSAYCDADEIQWLYFRKVTRGLSELDEVECEVCGGNLFVNERRGSYLSSSITPEVIGWISVGQNQTLNLVLTESSLGMLKDDLLADIQRHDFSGSISTVNLYQITYISRREVELARKSSLSSLKLIEKRKVLTAKKRKLEPLKLNPEDLSESPLRPPKSLSKKDLQLLKKFQEVPAESHTRLLTMRNSSIACTSLKRSQMKSRGKMKLAPSSFDTWTPAVRELNRSSKGRGRKKKPPIETEGQSLSGLK